MKYSQQGKQITFKCAVCGKEHYLDRMHYNAARNERICDDCFKEYRNNQKMRKDEK